MKFIITLSFLFLSVFSESQVLDTNKVNYDLLKESIFERVNAYRKSIGLDEVYYSKVIQTDISIVNINQMVKYDSLYHPGFSITDQNFVKRLSNEYVKLTTNKVGISDNSIIWIGNNGEIALSADRFSETYDDFSEQCLNAWLSSPPHKKTIETSFKDFNGFSGLGSCYIAKTKNTIYVVFNFMQLLSM